MQWPKNMHLVDANVILRYLLNDNKELAEASKKIIETGAYTKTEVLAEVVYVLKGVYSANRVDIKTFILRILDEIYCEEKPVVVYAMDVYAFTTLDFVDCLLIGYHFINHENIFSLDKRLNNYVKNPRSGYGMH